MRFHCDKVRVGDAGHKGRGVFAAVPIKKGEGIETAPALVIPDADVDRVASTILSSYTFAKRDAYEIVALGYASLYNHAFDPNAHFVIVRDAILIVALRAIAEGEEICFDYGWSEEGFRAAGITREDQAAETSPVTASS